jgi:hypothetical protein
MWSQGNILCIISSLIFDTNLSSTSNGNRAARSVAEGDNTIDSLDTDGIQRSATTVVSVTATTARGDTNA